MHGTRLRVFTVLVMIVGWGPQAPWARALKITIPRRSELTPVQRLNREGVEAVRKHQYERAEAFFYKAYLYDPSDPFTLNNLGYISELQGQLDRAQKFYALAQEQGCDAVIALSNARQLQGKPMLAALGDLKDLPMRVNRMNVEATQLLSQDRGFEAEMLLRQALELDPQNPFTLNDMGVAEETIGDFESALKYYDLAADTHSKEPVTIALDRAWRGKPVSEMAAESARELRQRMRHMNLDKARSAMLAMRGVSESNQNDWADARRDFLQAYSLNPSSAFALNNLGYVAERDGDLETAQFYYGRARAAYDANATIGLATKPLVEGQRLDALALQSDQNVDGELAQYSQARREEGGSIELLQRNGTPVDTGTAPPKPSSQPSPAGAPPAVSQPHQ